MPGIRFEDLPPIDVVLLSHNHYDYLDTGTLLRLRRVAKALMLPPVEFHDGTEAESPHPLRYTQRALRRGRIATRFVVAAMFGRWRIHCSKRTQR